MFNIKELIFIISFIFYINLIFISYLCIPNKNVFISVACCLSIYYVINIFSLLGIKL